MIHNLYIVMGDNDVSPSFEYQPTERVGAEAEEWTFSAVEPIAG